MDNDDIMNKLETDGIRLSTGKPISVELVEDDEDSSTYKIKFELMDVGVYNMFNFTEENLKFMVSEFQRDKNGVVSHGLDHSWDTLDQIGKVFDLQLEGKGKKTKVFALSELYKETPAQEQSHTLFKQGLLKFVSGGWFPTKYIWNDEENHIDIEDPKLREISSTPMPAKEDAKQKEILNSLNHAPMEELDMTDENQDKQEPSQDGEEVIVEQDAELIALKQEMSAEIEAAKKARTKMEEHVANVTAKQTEAEVASLMERAKELGLSEDLFKDGDTYKSPEAIRLALTAAKELKVELLSEQEPKVVLNGEGITLQNGTPEMADHLLKTHMPWLLEGL